MATESTPLVSDVDRDGLPVQYTGDEGQTRSTKAKKQTPLPKMQVFALFLAQFCEPVTGTVVYPFVVSLVNETGITGGDVTKTGYYAGIIESVFYAAEAVTAFAWGRASDYIGRKPPLLFGMLCMAAAIVAFGLSNTYWVLIVARCVQGFMNGNIGITKVALADLTDSTNMATAFSFIPLMWGMGVIIGPIIGGLFAHPAEQWPGVFGGIEFLRRYPYALPCCIAALVPLGAFVFMAIFFEETLQSAKLSKKKQALGSASVLEDMPPSANTPPPLSALITKPIVAIMLCYAFLAWTEQASGVLLTIMYPMPIEHGGLGLSSFAIGCILSATGLLVGLSSALLFPRAVARYGTTKVFQRAYLGYLITPCLYPLMNFLARRQGVSVFVWILIAMQVLLTTLCCQCFGAFFVLLSEAVPSESLGALNGLAQTVACSMRIFAPFTASSLFSLSQEKNLLGGTMVFWILELIAIIGVMVSYRLKQPSKIEHE